MFRLESLLTVNAGPHAVDGCVEHWHFIAHLFSSLNKGKQYERQPIPRCQCTCAFCKQVGLLSIKPFHDSCCTNNLVYCLCPKERETCPVFTQEQIPSQSSHNRQQAPSVSHQPLAALFSQPKITEKMVGVGVVGGPEFDK